MKIPFYQVDAFTNQPFRGNPAAVCPLPFWLPDDTLQAITIEHNQSETAFFVPCTGGFELRWFTTGNGEINLCGHATLASSHVIFNHLYYPESIIRFQTRFVGPLTVTRSDDWLTLDFPAWPPRVAEIPEAAIDGFMGLVPQAAYEMRDLLLVYPDEATILAARPNYEQLSRLGRMICITAPGSDCDFVSRFFCPGESQPEDPVTGSAHCMLAPYWADRLGKAEMMARQLSARGGELQCAMAGNRVHISGQARTYMQGMIELP